MKLLPTIQPKSKNMNMVPRKSKNVPPLSLASRMTVVVLGIYLGLCASNKNRDDVDKAAAWALEVDERVKRLQHDGLLSWTTHTSLLDCHTLGP